VLRDDPVYGTLLDRCASGCVISVSGWVISICGDVSALNSLKVMCVLRLLYMSDPFVGDRVANPLGIPDVIGGETNA
jgi:hypothetical protein